MPLTSIYDAPELHRPHRFVGGNTCPTEPLSGPSAQSRCRRGTPDHAAVGADALTVPPKRNISEVTREVVSIDPCCPWFVGCSSDCGECNGALARG